MLTTDNWINLRWIQLICNKENHLAPEYQWKALHTQSLTSKDVEIICFIWSQSRPQGDMIDFRHQALGQSILVPWIVGWGRCSDRGLSRSSIRWQDIIIIFSLFLRVNNRQSYDSSQGACTKDDSHHPNTFTDVETFPHVVFPTLKHCMQQWRVNFYMKPWVASPLPFIIPGDTLTVGS